MRKVHTLSVGFALFCVGLISGSETEAVRNGTTWKGLELSEKTAYTAGFVDGYVGGFNDGATVTVDKYLSPEPPKLTTEQKQSISDLAPYAITHARIVVRSKATRAQIMDAMATFYGDQQNTPICWNDAFLFSAASLANRAPTEQQLDSAREAGIKSGCK